MMTISSYFNWIESQASKPACIYGTFVSDLHIHSRTYVVASLEIWTVSLQDVRCVWKALQRESGRRRVQGGIEAQWCVWKVARIAEENWTRSTRCHIFISCSVCVPHTGETAGWLTTAMSHSQKSTSVDAPSVVRAIERTSSSVADMQDTFAVLSACLTPSQVFRPDRDFKNHCFERYNSAKLKSTHTLRRYAVVHFKIRASNETACAFCHHWINVRLVLPLGRLPSVCHLTNFHSSTLITPFLERAVGTNRSWEGDQCTQHSLKTLDGKRKSPGQTYFLQA